MQKEDDNHKIWKCADSFVHPVPIPPNGVNSWNELLGPLKTKDQKQCDSWKDEIQNLLIFAGLFSAVVTAFVIVSFQDLQPDPNQATIALLAQIATTLDSNSQNNTSAVAALPPPLPSASNTSSRIALVNTLWFISLVLSLTIALVGIVALQWLREYQRYPIDWQSAPDRDSLAHFNMRFSGLKEWYVPQIFAALPVLLLLSLLLFLAGLSEFLLLNASLSVSIPVIIIILMLPVTFIILTTILPSFEWLLPPTTFFHIRRLIPAQCPYKSPQSSLLRNVLTPILSFLLSSLLSFLPGFGKNVRNVADSWKLLLSTFPRHGTDRSDIIALYYREVCHEELYRKKFEGLHYTKADPIFTLPAHLRTAVPPLYDCIAGLKAADAQGSRYLSVQAACYQCITDVSKDQQNVFISREEWLVYIQSMLQNEWPNCDPHVPLIHFTKAGEDNTTDERINTTFEETSVSTLRGFDWDASARSVHGHELHIRLMHYYLRNISREPPFRLDLATRERLKYFWRNTSPMTGNSDISEQYTRLLRVLFISKGLSNHDSTRLEFLPHPHLAQFVETASQNQSKPDMLRTIELIEQLTTYLFTRKNLDPIKEDLRLVLMASYLGEIQARQHYLSSSPLLAPVEDSVKLATKKSSKALYAVIIKLESHNDLFRGSILAGELYGYRHFLEFASTPSMTPSRPPSPTASHPPSRPPSRPPSPPLEKSTKPITSVARLPDILPTQIGQKNFPRDRIRPKPSDQQKWASSFTDSNKPYPDLS